jgi:hypothetical protein
VSAQRLVAESDLDMYLSKNAHKRDAAARTAGQ